MKVFPIALLWFWVALAVGSCTPTRQHPPFFGGMSASDASLAASAMAEKIGGISYYVLDTKSMEPELSGGDYVVVDIKARYEDIQVGFMLAYKARWLDKNHPLVTHWVAAQLGKEWIMDGQNNPSYENNAEFRMGRAEYEYKENGRRLGGKVIAIYSTRKSQTWIKPDPQ